MSADQQLNSEERRCFFCSHFDASPASAERNVPGLRVMGSGYSSVRGEDGSCNKLQRYLSGHYSCAAFQNCAHPTATSL